MMLKCLKSSAAALALVLSAPVAMAQDADTVVATVDGTEITLGHMIMARAGLPEQYLSLPDETLWNGILDQLIQQTILGASGPEDLSKRVEIALQNEERSLRAAEAVEAIVETAATDEAVQDAYTAAYSDGGAIEYNAAHILVETQEAATALVEEARGGAEFAALAVEHSTGPSGPNGGDLGWFGDGMMVAPFEEAVKELTAGDVSDPVQTQFGWHVIKLNETRVQEAPPLEEVRTQLEQQVQAEAVETTIDELMAAAEITRTNAIETDPSLIKNLDLLSD